MKSRAQFVSVRFGLSFPLLVTLIVSAISPVHDAAAANYNFSPKNGPPGTSVHVTVSGTPAKADLTVHGKASGFDADLCSFTTDNNGKGGCSFKVPHVSGTISLTLTGPKVGSSDIGPFKVTNSNGGGGGNNHNGNSHNGNGNGNNGNNGKPGVPIAPPPSIRIPPVACHLRPDNCAKEERQADLAREEFLCLTGDSLLDCRHISEPLGGPQILPDFIENPLTALECAKAILAAPTILGLVQLGLSNCQFLPLPSPPPPPPLTVGPNVPLPSCVPGQTGNALGCDGVPGSTFEPASVPSNTQGSTDDIRNSVDQQNSGHVSEPSAQMVRNQQTTIRNQVCAKAPSNGAGGCPKGS